MERYETSSDLNVIQLLLRRVRLYRLYLTNEIEHGKKPINIFLLKSF